jgi:hypothetical protein
MKQRKKHKGAQWRALLYGRSSRAIRIVNGEKVGSNAGAVRTVNDGKSRSVNKQKPHIVTKASGTVKPEQKKHQMSEEAKKKLDKLQDPLEMLNRTARTQKYEAAKSSEKYEYGLSDW